MREALIYSFITTRLLLFKNQNRRSGINTRATFVEEMEEMILASFSREKMLIIIREVCHQSFIQLAEMQVNVTMCRKRRNYRVADASLSLCFTQ